MWANDDVAHARGSAWRRRQRRLRAHWRHEQLTLQMLLATYEHHAAERGQSRARSAGEARDVLHGRVPDAPLPQGSREGTEFYSMSEDSDAVGGRRDVRPQERVQQRTMEQIVDPVPLVPLLHGRCCIILRSSSLLSSRPLKFQFRVVQEGWRGGLQCLPGQDSNAFFGADRVDIPSGGFSHFSPMEKSAGLGPHSRSELSAHFNPSTLSAHQMPPEQLVDVPVPQIPERTGRRELDEVLRRLQEVEENALLAEEEVDEDEEEEEVEGSRFLPHFRPRRSCWYVQAGGICPRGWQCTFAHHESELHPISW